MPGSATVLVIDDEIRSLEAIRRVLAEEFEVISVRGAQEAEEVLAGDEPFSVEWTAQHGLRQLALQAVESGWSEADERRVAAAAGWLPVGELGQAHWGQIRGPIRAFAPTLFDERPADAAQPLVRAARHADHSRHRQDSRAAEKDDIAGSGPTGDRMQHLSDLLPVFSIAQPDSISTPAVL